MLPTDRERCPGQARGEGVDSHCEGCGRRRWVPGVTYRVIRPALRCIPGGAKRCDNRISTEVGPAAIAAASNLAGEGVVRNAG